MEEVSSLRSGPSFTLVFVHLSSAEDSGTLGWGIGEGRIVLKCLCPEASVWGSAQQ